MRLPIRLALLALLASGCASPASTGSAIRFEATEVRPGQSLVENAAAAPDLSTFVSVLQAAEMARVLAGPGPFTVFAPTDAAFEAVDAAAFGELLLPENRGRLRALLEGHVVRGVVTAAELGAGATLTTLSGRTLTVAAEPGGAVRLGAEAGVVRADVRAANGVAHVIDAVLTPERR